MKCDAVLSPFAKEIIEEARPRILAEGQAELLLRLLRRRFGAIPPETEAMIHGAEMADIDRWSARLFDATRLTDVLDDDPDHPSPPTA